MITDRPFPNQYEPNRATKYQVVLETPQRIVHLGFTARRTRRGLIAVAQCVSPEEWRVAGLQDGVYAQWVGKGRYPALLLPGVGTLRFGQETRYTVHSQKGGTP